MAEVADNSATADGRIVIQQSRPARQALRQYGYAVAAVGLAFAIRYALTPILHDRVPFMLFVPAILIASAAGRFAHGMLSTALGLLLGSFFMSSFPPLSLA